MVAVVEPSTAVLPAVVVVRPPVPRHFPRMAAFILRQVAVAVAVAVPVALLVAVQVLVLAVDLVAVEYRDWYFWRSDNT